MVLSEEDLLQIHLKFWLGDTKTDQTRDMFQAEMKSRSVERYENHTQPCSDFKMCRPDYCGLSDGINVDDKNPLRVITGN